ncbi:hypothetical protein Gotri_026764 [Gossypium trilobum]|uniref:Uncharacterized protein n=1 Tax=Gossypium trilobum TaxID=34281 RepID=A0A7J9FKB4_9ROSI|nr:hypothetical protein [Gossypium trilobum]
MLLALKTHRLLPFVEETVAVLPKLIIGEDGVFLENSTFAQYEKQDSALLVWLLSTVSLALQNQLIGSSSSAAKLWEALTRVLGTQTTTKVMRSRSLLRFKKNTLSMSVYLEEIKHLCDLLASCGHNVSLEEQQSTILNGLPPKFDHVVLIITTSRVSSHFGPQFTSGSASYIYSGPQFGATPYVVANPVWYPDSGATTHITHDSTQFNSSQSY